MKKAKNKKKKGGLLDNRRVVLVISFISALIIWVIVGGWIKPNDNAIIDNVIIDYTRNSSNYKNRDLEIVGNVPETVSVEVSGDGNILLSLVSTDIVVYPDYSAVNEAGTYEIPLRAIRESTGFDIESLTPDTVTLQFEKSHRTVYTLGVQADGITADNGYYRDEPELSTLQVEVTGPEGEMELIAGATVIIDEVTTRSSSYTISDADVVLVDKNGDILQTSDLVSVSPSVVTVEIPIVPEKVVQLEVGITGANAGFDTEWFMGLVTLSRDTITVAGEAALLENLDSLSVGDIDITTFTIGSTHESFDVMLPEGLKNITGLQVVTATLNPSSLSQRSFEVPLENITVIGGPDDLEILPVGIVDEDATYEVTLMGDSEVINALLPENIAVQIVATDVQADGDEQQNLPVRVYVPRSGRVYAVNSYTLLCDVGELQEEEEADASGS